MGEGRGLGVAVEGDRRDDNDALHQIGDERALAVLDVGDQLGRQLAVGGFPGAVGVLAAVDLEIGMLAVRQA